MGYLEEIDMYSQPRTRIQDVDPDFMRSRGGDFDFFNLQGLSSSPTDSSLAFDSLSDGVRHCVNRDGGGTKERKQRLGNVLSP